MATTRKKADQPPAPKSGGGTLEARSGGAAGAGPGPGPKARAAGAGSKPPTKKK